MAYHARPCQFVTLSSLLLCIIHGYPPRSVSSSLSFVVHPLPASPPRRFYRFCSCPPSYSPPPPPPPPSFVLHPSLFYVSQYFPFNLTFFSSIFPGPSRSCRLTISRCYSLSLPPPLSLREDDVVPRCGDERVRRIVIMRSHLSCLASLESRRGGARKEERRREESDCKREQVVMIA